MQGGIKILPPALLSILLLFFSGCQAQEKKEHKINNSDSIGMNTTDIIRHLNLQKRYELSEDDTDTTHMYHLTDADIEIAAEIIAKALKNSGYTPPSDKEFFDKINTLFGFSNLKKCANIIEHKTFFTYLISQSGEDVRYLRETEYYYAYNHVFFIKNYKFITHVPLLGDMVKITADNKIKMDVDPRIISRNKYLFNNSKAALAYLLHEDQNFLKILVTVFGYDKEPKINKLVMDEYLKMKENRRDVIGEIIFTKDCTGKLNIRQGLLKYIEENTSADDNALLYALESYGSVLYNGDMDKNYKEDPFKKFTADEKAVIAAYIASVDGPLFRKYSPYSPSATTSENRNMDVWTRKGSFLYNLSVQHPEVLDIIAKNNYYGLTHLKREIELLDAEAPPPAAD